METTNPDYTGNHFYVDRAVNGVIGGGRSKLKPIILLPNVLLEIEVNGFPSDDDDLPLAT